jgi:hypothetical protein
VEVTVVFGLVHADGLEESFPLGPLSFSAPVSTPASLRQILNQAKTLPHFEFERFQPVSLQSH